ncbi:helix-turn-helix domain-containing protein [Niveispirillum lacus]
MLLTLEEAAVRLRPDGLISARSLRSEISAGRLQPTRIAGRIFVAESDLDEFIQAARQSALVPKGRAHADAIATKQPRARRTGAAPISSSAHLTAVADRLTRRRG